MSRTFEQAVDFTRLSAGTRFNRLGLLVTEPDNTKRRQHDPATLNTSTQQINVGGVNRGQALTVALDGDHVYAVGDDVYVTDAGNIDRFVAGRVTAAEAGSVTIEVKRRAGVGPASDWVVIVALGLLVEGSAANQFLNNESPATQDIALSSGTHTLSFYGTGEILLSGGATGTLTGTGTERDRVTLTFTADGTAVTFTVSGDPVLPQVESGSAASGVIITGGQAATRAPDLPTVPDNQKADTEKGTYIFKGAYSDGSVSQHIPDVLSSLAYRGGKGTTVITKNGNTAKVYANGGFLFSTSAQQAVDYVVSQGGSTTVALHSYLPYELSAQEASALTTGGDVVLENFGPGPTQLVAGDFEAGFFGEVSSEEFISGDDLTAEVGVTEGTSQHSDAGWLKFAHNNQAIFIAKRPIRNSISWDHLYSLGLVYGTDDDGVAPRGTPTNQRTIVTINGADYIVRLMTGANEDPYDDSDPRYLNDDMCELNLGQDSEWNDLIYRVHEDTPQCPAIINEIRHGGAQEGGNWAQFTNGDLTVGSGNGRATWCQEAEGSVGSDRRIFRGFASVAHFDRPPASITDSFRGWRPVLVPVKGESQ